MANPIDHADPAVVLRAEGVDFVRDGRLLLDQIRVTVRAGEHWALLGPNGAGKSPAAAHHGDLRASDPGPGGHPGLRLGRVNVFSLRPLIGHVSPHHR